MHITTHEFKAKVENHAFYEAKLLELSPRFGGTDHQVDTYFRVPKGRLKLREGNIENALINYSRENVAGTKGSEVILFTHQPDPALREILTLQLGVRVVVSKQRKIYFIENVKFHFDTVAGLGHFIEVEALDHNNSFTPEHLQRQCNYYLRFFELASSSLIDRSYSDLLEEGLPGTEPFL